MSFEPAAPPKVAIVILNWNGIAFLRRFLPSVLASNYPNMEVWVVDNASNDESVLWLQTHHATRVKIVVNECNGGFAEGYNKALKQIQADYYVLLNSDVEVPSNWICPIIAQMEADRSIAACQPKLLAHENRHLFEYAGAAGGYIDSWGYPFCRGRLFDYCETDTGQYDETCEVFWASGAALFIRANIFEQLGGFDVRFFAHMEEIDLCWRIRRAGYRVFCCPKSVVYHVGGGTLQKANPFKTYLNFRNNLLMLCNHLPTQQLIGTLVVRLFLDSIAALVFLIRGQISLAWAVCRAQVHFWFSFPANIRHRWQVQKRIESINPSLCTTAREGIYKGSIVWAYQVQKKRVFRELK